MVSSALRISLKTCFGATCHTCGSKLLLWNVRDKNRTDILRVTTDPLGIRITGGKFPRVGTLLIYRQN